MNADDDNELSDGDSSSAPKCTAPLHDRRNVAGLVENDTTAEHTEPAFATLDELNHTDALALIVDTDDANDAHWPAPFFHRPATDDAFVTEPPQPCVIVVTAPPDALVHASTDGPTAPLAVEFANTLTEYAVAFEPHTSVTECGPAYAGANCQYETHDTPAAFVNVAVVTFCTAYVVQPASVAHALLFEDGVAYTLYRLSGDAMHPPTPVNDAYVSVWNTTLDDDEACTAGYTELTLEFCTF